MKHLILIHLIPDDRQETPNDPQETVDDPQDTCQVRQVKKMTEYSWRNLSFDEEVDTHLLNHFCMRGTSEKDRNKPGKPALFGLLLKSWASYCSISMLKYMVASGKLVIKRTEDGVPILSRGHVQLSGHVQPRALQETNNNLRVLSNESWQTQTQSQAHTQQTPSQLAHANARSAKMSYEKATRIAQERTQ
jgi:hypothetical protein